MTKKDGRSLTDAERIDGMVEKLKESGLWDDEKAMRRILSSKFAEEEHEKRHARWALEVNLPTLGEWHVCDDCFDPTADHIENVLVEWQVGDRNERGLGDGIDAVEIWWRWGGRAPWPANSSPPDIGFALVWLSVNVSKAAAEELSSRLAWTIKKGKEYVKEDVEFWAKIPPAPPMAVNQELTKSFFPEIEGEVSADDPRAIKSQGPPRLRLEDYRMIQEKQQTIYDVLHEFIEYLRRLSVVLRAKIANEPVRREQVQQTRRFINGNDDRDKWIYEQCCTGAPYKEIINDLRKRAEKKKGWERIETIQGVKEAARRYAERNNLPPIPNRSRKKE